MLDTERAYIAGMLDGEGNISIAKHVTSKRKRPVYAGYCAIANNNLEVLEWIHSKVGGYICKNKKLPGRKQGFVLRFSAGDTRRLLESVREFLIIKKDKAALLLRFFDECKKPGRTHMSEEDALLQQTFYDKFKELNRKGEPCQTTSV